LPSHREPFPDSHKRWGSQGKVLVDIADTDNFVVVAAAAAAAAAAAVVVDVVDDIVVVAVVEVVAAEAAEVAAAQIVVVASQAALRVAPVRMSAHKVAGIAVVPELVLAVVLVLAPRGLLRLQSPQHALPPRARHQGSRRQETIRLHLLLSSTQVGLPHVPGQQPFFLLAVTEGASQTRVGKGRGAQARGTTTFTNGGDVISRCET